MYLRVSPELLQGPAYDGDGIEVPGLCAAQPLPPLVWPSSSELLAWGAPNDQQEAVGWKPVGDTLECRCVGSAEVPDVCCYRPVGDAW
eukprot:513768-Prorocentrum_lima.AAC.1